MPTFLERIKARKFSTAASTAVDIGVNGDSQSRLTIDAGGKLLWGSGSLVGDVNLYRHAADTLKTDDTLVVADLYIGSAQVVITDLSSEASIDGGAEDIRILEAEINISELNSTVDGGTV